MNGGIKFFVEFVCAGWVPYGIYLMCTHDVSAFENLLFNYIILMMNMGMIALAWYYCIINLMAYTCGCVGEKSFSGFTKFVPGLKLGVHAEEMIPDDKKNCWQKFTSFMNEVDDLSVHNDEAYDFNIINKMIKEKQLKEDRSSTRLQIEDEEANMTGENDIEETK